MRLQEIRRQLFQFRCILHRDCVAALLHIAPKAQRGQRRLILQLLDPRPRRVVLIHAGQPILQQRALQIMLRGRIRPARVYLVERLIHIAVQRKLNPRL